MSIRKETVCLYDENDILVESELIYSILDFSLKHWREDWRYFGEECNVSSDLSEEHLHWDWAEKLKYVDNLLGYSCFSVISQSMTQGMMITNEFKLSKLKGSFNLPIIYIDYLESAPWNRRSWRNGKKRLRPVGSILIGAAINLSLERGYKGRVGLHALPQAIGFYSKSGMENLGKDPEYENLCYFEMTPENASEFLK